MQMICPVCINSLDIDIKQKSLNLYINRLDQSSIMNKFGFNNLGSNGMEREVEEYFG